jgi:hypothetical protein
MELPEQGMIHWLIKKAKIKDVVGFYWYKGGFYIIGGETGSHHSGHADKPIDKWALLLSNDYVVEKDARDQGLVPKEWKPPEIKSIADRRLISHIDSTEGYNRYKKLKPWWIFG